MTNEIISVTPSSDEWAVMKEQAKDLAASPLLPEPLRGTRKGGQFTEFPPEVKVANLLLVADAARLYGQNFRAFAAECFVLGGRLDYSGKMYAAIFNSSNFCIEPLDYELSGQGENRTCYISGWAEGMNGRRGFSVPIIMARKQDRPTPEWHHNPDQMLCYASARMWVRRFAFACTLGVTPPPDRLEKCMDVKEPGEEPLPAIEEQPRPESQEKLAEDVPTREYIEWRERLAAAKQSRIEIEKWQDMAKGSRLSKKEFDRLMDEGRKAWKDCKSASFDRWSIFLTPDMEPDELLQCMAEIDDDATLSPGEKNLLAERCRPSMERPAQEAT